MNAIPHLLTPVRSGKVESVDDLVLQCPRCRQCAGTISRSHAPERADLICATCLITLRLRRGIWNALLPEREAYFAKFLDNYEAIRSAEGRGSSDSAFYLALPDKDLSGKNEEQWKIRRRTFQCLETEIIGPIASRVARGLDILDLGAGNAWLSYRAALRGHRPVAVDLIDNDFDGLCAAQHYRQRIPGMFPRVRAEFDYLPFSMDQFDVVIFNASFHYSEDYARTLSEALRCVRRPGWIVIADTAWYRHESQGEEMLRERAAIFTDRFGTASNALNSREFLTDERLQALEQSYGLRWQRFDPQYGIRWRMRPFIAKLRGRREPSRFRIYVAEVTR
ncbi:hypothetical protein Acid345_0878 [Candidatus Koribacter versatilis Ellin345]|uniref:Methyltransferase type 11 domain-containing protein n=1 Tax=Koribacter versatilis (strain Ellin345) TaxID=204669 RepID=Q1ITB9_KORVE|nr:class I SAM-dependent methyltransferase [Candidatus Koribacter versatilis]ABF39881.1 hypothetical protein Acid345_0878 [Candidatus Koribacter versatilis Ellin345]